MLILLLIVLAVLLTVGLTELVKKFEAVKRLKAWRAWIPVLFSAFFSFLLWQGAFFSGLNFWLLWAIIFSFSVLSYETVIKRLKDYFDIKNMRFKF